MTVDVDHLAPLAVFHSDAAILLIPHRARQVSIVQTAAGTASQKSG